MITQDVLSLSLRIICLHIWDNLNKYSGMEKLICGTNWKRNSIWWWIFKDKSELKLFANISPLINYSDNLNSRLRFNDSKEPLTQYSKDLNLKNFFNFTNFPDLLTPRVILSRKELVFFFFLFSLFSGRRARANRAIFGWEKAVTIFNNMLYRKAINLRRTNLCNLVTHASPSLTFSRSLPYGALIDRKIYMQIDEGKNPFCGANWTTKANKPPTCRSTVHYANLQYA